MPEKRGKDGSNAEGKDSDHFAVYLVRKERKIRLVGILAKGCSTKRSVQYSAVQGEEKNSKRR